MTKRKERLWTDADLIKACEDNYTYADVMRDIGMPVASGNYKTLKRHIEMVGVDISHFSPGKTKIPPRRRFSSTLEDVMVENSTYHRASLKKRIIKRELIEYRCAICGMPPVWNNMPMVLRLDHINGINNDHRKENLRFVCPNCDSQLPTYCGKSKTTIAEARCVDCGVKISKQSTRCKSCSQKAIGKTRTKIEWPVPSALLKMLEELNGNHSALSRELGVSDNAIRKHIKRHCL